MNQNTVALVGAVAGWAITAIIVFVWIRREDKRMQRDFEEHERYYR